MPLFYDLVIIHQLFSEALIRENIYIFNIFYQFSISLKGKCTLLTYVGITIDAHINYVFIILAF